MAKTATVTWADAIEPEPVVWAWTGSFESDHEDSEGSHDENGGSSESCGRIAAGTIAIAAGPEGVGKSSFGIALASRVSTGTLQGAWRGRPRNVLYVAVEDSWTHTLVPRLMAAGADRSRIGRLDVMVEPNESSVISLPVDNGLLEEAIVEHDVALVVLDPLLSLIADSIDTNNERKVRKALDPLAAIADRTQAVLLGIAHFNKSQGSDISARITGSGAFKNVPRAIFGFGRDPESVDRECVLTQSKNSLGRSNLPSIRYRVESASVQTPKGQTITGRFAPIGLSEKSLDEILAGASTGPIDDPADRLSVAQEFIVTYIGAYANERGQVPSRDVLAQGEQEGYSRSELIKARSNMGDRVGTRKVGKDGGWNWFLVQGEPATGIVAVA
ncbi:AAA family ATPase [Mycobacterium intracellulare]|uniref:AAA family ATPase n=1 Tax=Mycobacterium intracellulare TaxID=1767 RepID=UPI0034D35573